jgi:uncharacterized protein YjbI with pentapeptide repeats
VHSGSDPERPKMTRQQVEKIVADARHLSERPNLNVADLRGADLRGADLRRADLRVANLIEANLSGADLSGADLSYADLAHADLARADLTDANLNNADLRGADLRGADLRGADLMGTALGDIDLAECHFGSGVIACTDLSLARNIGQARHDAPTEVGSGTLESTAAELEFQPETQRSEVFTFLQKAGVSEALLSAMRLLIDKPIEFYSCFISYSHADKEFARFLYDRLQGRGIRCWLDEHQLLPGDDIYDMVDRGIRLWDKTVLCCSEASLSSWWVQDEIDKTFEKERRVQKERGQKPGLLVPLDLDGALFGWEDGRASQLRRRFAPSFVGWEKDTNLFGERVDNVIKALRSDSGAREEPPAPKL